MAIFFENNLLKNFSRIVISLLSVSGTAVIPLRKSESRKNFWVSGYSIKNLLDNIGEEIYMAGKVFGVYQSREAALEAIRQLKKQDAKGQEITVIADSPDTLGPVNREDIDTIALESDENESALLGTIKTFFGLDGKSGADETLNALSVSPEEKAAYLNQIENGAILVAVNVDEELGPDLNDASYEGEDREASPYNPNINLYRGL